MANNNEQPRVYFLPIYAPGHLISMLEVAKGLLQCNSTSSTSFSIHILLTQPIHDPEKANSHIPSYLQSLQTHDLPIHLHPLPSVEPPRQLDGTEDFVTLYIRSYLPHIKAALLASPSPVSGLVVDMFATDVIDVANKLNIPSYIYWSSTATFLSLVFHLASLQGKRDPIDFSEVDEEICVNGLTPIPSKSIPVPLLDMKSASYKCFMYCASRYMEAKGIIINSNIHIEKKAVKALAQGVTDQLAPGTGRMFPEMFPVGPVISFQRSNVQGHECLQWLDRQPAKSVMFLCFGSFGAFPMSQVRQIATGLEQSGHRFLWVFRMPTAEFLR